MKKCSRIQRVLQKTMGGIMADKLIIVESPAKANTIKKENYYSLMLKFFSKQV